MIAGQATADIDIEAATRLYSAKCAICHGIDGNATLPMFPKLAGQQITYLNKTLADYHSGPNGARPNAIMTPLALTLTQSDSANLSAYLSTQTAHNGAASKSSLVLGQKLYRAGDVDRHIPPCAACHGPAGLGNRDAAYPQLAGQNSAYIISQLQLFHDDQRRSDPRGMMRDIAKRLNTEDQSALASFINGLRPQ